MLDQVEGKIEVYKLEIDGSCPFDEFLKDIELDPSFRRFLVGAFSILDDVVNLKLVPMQKFRNITRRGETTKEFEIKKSALRIYLFKTAEGFVIVLGGKKNNQKRDIERFRKIKNRYLQTLRR